MINKLTGKRFEVRPVQGGGASFSVPVAQLPDVLGVLERHGFFHWPNVGQYTNDGVNWVTGVEISRKEDPAAVQAALDAVE